MSAFNQNQNNQPPLDPKQQEQLNAYLDYELSEAEREQVRDLLRRSPAAENELATLRATRQVMRELPNVANPRSFVVRPYMLEQLPPRRPSIRIFGWRLSAALGLSLGSVAAASLLVLLLVVQLASSPANNLTTSIATVAQATAPPAQPSNANTPTSDNYTAASEPAPTTATAEANDTSASPMARMPATPTEAIVASSAAAAPTSPPAAAKQTPPTPATDSGNAGAAPPPVVFPPTSGNTSDAGDTTSGESAPTDTPTTSPTYTTFSAQGGTPPTPELKVQANNPTDNGGSIDATNSGLPSQNTNRTGDTNLNPYQRGMDYWLISEIALAILVVILGLGAIIAQRRSRL